MLETLQCNYNVSPPLCIHPALHVKGPYLSPVEEPVPDPLRTYGP